jgi:hypothetical protein
LIVFCYLATFFLLSCCFPPSCFIASYFLYRCLNCITLQHVA